MCALEFDDELISQIKREAVILKSMIDEIEDEFRRKGKKLGEHYYERKSSLFFDAKEYATEVQSKLHSQMRKIIRLLQKCFPWAPIDESILYSDYCKTVSYEVESSGSSYVLFNSELCCAPFRDLMNPYEQDEFLKELFKPVYVCIARILQTTADELDPSSSYLKEYDPIVLSEALKMAENKKWIIKKDGSYFISERPVLVIKCPVCDEKVYAHEDNCPQCGFYIPNLALRTKVRLEIPTSWYKYDGQQKKWVAFFKYICPSSEEVILGEILSPLGGEWKVSIPSIWYSVSGSLETANVIHSLPDEYYFATHYTHFLRTEPIEILYMKYKACYAIYASSLQELKQIIMEIMDRLKFEANREYDRKYEDIEIRKIPREKFIQEFLSRIQRCFIPALDKHPVLMLENMVRQDEENIRMTVDYKKELVKRLEKLIERP
jgi:hypothetical protein